VTLVFDNLKEGDVLAGRFVIERLIGEGGMGFVYQALQHNLGRRVAIKAFDPTYGGLSQGKERFIREARVASTLKHPNAVEIYDLGADDGVAWLAMELLEGGSLRGAMDHAAPFFPMPEVLRVVTAVLELLVQAHAIELVHRDIKPENIFVELSGRVRVLDFGIAFINDDPNLGRMTQEGIVVGTPDYIAPEQAQGLPVGPRSDIYALGVMFYELLAGHAPFVGSHVSVLSQHLYVTPPPLSGHREGGIPADLESLVMQMLSKRADDRPSAAEVLHALSGVEGTLAGERHRGRDDEMLKGRAARMISVAAPLHPTVIGDVDLPNIPAGERAIGVGVVGDLDPEIAVGLASNGLRAEALDPDDSSLADHIDAVLACNTSLAVIQQMVGRGRPVLVIVTDPDPDTLALYLRLGVREIVRQPVRVADLTRKLRRAHARAQRKPAES